MKNKNRVSVKEMLPIICFILAVINLFFSCFCGVFSLFLSLILVIWTLLNIKNKDILYNISLFLSVLAIIIFVCINYLGIFAINNRISNEKAEKYMNIAADSINYAKEDYIQNGFKSSKCYSLKVLNNINNNQLKFSPIGEKYSETSFVKIYTDRNGVIGASICLVDVKNNGFNYVDQSNLTRSYLKIGNADLCIIPNDCK